MKKVKNQRRTSNNNSQKSGSSVSVAGSSDSGFGSERKATETGIPRAAGCVGTLIEIHSDEVNGFNDQAEEWEEVEFLVDSGASAAVLGEGEVRAMKPSAPNPDRNYKLAHGSTIPQKGSESFKAVRSQMWTALC